LFAWLAGCQVRDLAANLCGPSPVAVFIGKASTAPTPARTITQEVQVVQRRSDKYRVVLSYLTDSVKLEPPRRRGDRGAQPPDPDIPRVIIFVATKAMAENLTRQLQDE
jgi:superfamily II DNA/RNA helicase